MEFIITDPSPMKMFCKIWDKRDTLQVATDSDRDQFQLFLHHRKCTLVENAEQGLVSIGSQTSVLWSVLLEAGTFVGYISMMK